jgi:hypothetical protein
MNLKRLYLGKFMIKTENNKIESIEQLQFMNMPLLKELCLGKAFVKSETNNITKVSSLNKCAWNSLWKINLGIDLIKGQVRTQLMNLILPG